MMAKLITGLLTIGISRMIISKVRKHVNHIGFSSLCVLIASFVSSTAKAETLDEAIRIALNCNPQVLAAKQNRLSIDNVIDQARSPYFPQIKASVSYGPQQSQNSNTISAQLGNGSPRWVTMPVRQINLTLDQMLFDGFATRGEVQRNTARANSAAYQLLTVIQDTAWNTVQAYLEVMKEKELVMAAEQNLAAHNSILDSVRLRTKNGLSTEADLVQMEGRTALARSNLFAEKSNLQDATARYRRAVGEYPMDLVSVDPLLPCQLPQTLNDAEDFSLRHHPTIKVAQSDIMAAYQQYKVSKSFNYPRLDLQMGVDRNSNVGGVRGPDNDQFVFAKLSYELYSGGARINRQRETVHSLNQAQDILHNSYRQAMEDTKFSWDALVASRQILSLLKEHKLSTFQTIDAYKKQFVLGKRSLLDFLSVQSEYYASNREYIEGRYKIIFSEYQLLHSMGSLVQTLHVPLPCETNTYPLFC